MLDTLRFIVPLRHSRKLISAYIAKYPAQRSRRYWEAKIRGVYGNTIASISTVHKGTALKVEVCAPKFLYGHNVFGFNNVRRQIKRILRRIYAELGANAEPALDRIELERVDLALNLRLANHCTPEVALGGLQQVVYGEHKHVKVFQNHGQTESVYLHPAARDKEIKWYSKRRELAYRPIPPDVPMHRRITKWANAVVRFEVRLNKAALRALKLRQLSAWSIAVAKRTVANILDRVDVSGKGVVLPADDPTLDVLSPHDRGLVLVQLHGVDIHRVYLPRTLKRARARIWKLARHDLYGGIPEGKGISVEHLLTEPTIRRFGCPKWAVRRMTGHGARRRGPRKQR